MSQQADDAKETRYVNVPDCRACGEPVPADGEHYRLQSRRPQTEQKSEFSDVTEVEIEWSWGPEVIHFHKECFNASGASDPPAYKSFRVVEAGSGVTHALMPTPPYSLGKRGHAARTVCGIESFNSDAGRDPETRDDLETAVTCDNCQRGLPRALDEVKR